MDEGARTPATLAPGAACAVHFALGAWSKACSLSAGDVKAWVRLGQELMQRFLMEAWYVVHAKARQERLAAEQLRRQHYHVYLPLLRTPKRRRGHWRDVIEPLFPGYLFIRVDLHLQNTAPIRSTYGVIGLVRFGGETRPVPGNLVECLLSAETDPQGAIRQEHLFQSGDRVEIASGPLAGLKGIFLAASGQERAQLLLDLLGRSNRVLVSQHQLVPVR